MPFISVGGGAWTAGIPNNEQRLGIDLGYRHVITHVATQGRRGSYEYVTEYYLEFSSDNKTWSVYTNQYGTPLVSLSDFCIIKLNEIMGIFLGEKFE